MGRASRSPVAQPTDLPDANELELSASNEQTSDLPSEPTTPSGNLAFRTPTLEEPTSEWDDASPSDSAESSELPAEPSGRPRRSSKASSAESPFSREHLRDTVRGGVAMASALAHDLLVHDPADAAVGLYLADEDDQAAIGDPLANIASRHLGDLGDVGNPDLGDAIAALIGLAVYAFKQVRRRKMARQLRNAPATAASDGRTEQGQGDGPSEGVAPVYDAAKV